MQAQWAPLDAATLSEVLARVAFRLAERRARGRPEAWRDPRAFVYNLVVELDRDGWQTMATYLASMHHNAIRNGTKLQQERDAIVRRSRCHARHRAEGRPWKRAW